MTKYSTILMLILNDYYFLIFLVPDMFYFSFYCVTKYSTNLMLY